MRNEVITTDGKMTGLYLTGIVCFFSLVLSVTLRLFQLAKWWTGFFIAVLILSVLSLFSWFFIHEYLGAELAPTYYLLFNHFFNWHSVFVVLMNIFCVFLPGLAYEYIRRIYFPKDYQIIQEIDVKNSQKYVDPNENMLL